MPLRCHLLEDFGVEQGVFSDREECCLGAVISERFEHGRGVVQPWTIVKGEQHFVGPKEIVHFEVLKSETWAACRVNFDHARYAERFRIARTSAQSCRRRNGYLGQSRRCRLGRRSDYGRWGSLMSWCSTSQCCSWACCDGGRRDRNLCEYEPYTSYGQKLVTA